jgi:hypothetical protein
LVDVFELVQHVLGPLLLCHELTDCFEYGNLCAAKKGRKGKERKGKWGEVAPTNHLDHDGRAAALRVKVREMLGDLAIKLIDF